MSKVTLKVEIEEEVYKALLSGYEEPYSRMFSDTVKNATPITESDDAVSRQAVLKINENHHGEMPNHINFEIWNEIKALPSVLPKREQGEWIGVNPMVDTLMCSKCGENIISEEFKSNYCPNCGAKMR